MIKDQRNYILLTIDVEDWFQVENFTQWISSSSWSSHELRVEKNTHLLLDLLDLFSSQRWTDNGEQKKVHATFFVLGWIAQRLPHLVRDIHARGHEVASHGYHHKLLTKCSPKELRIDLKESKKILEDIIGDGVYGYRAPSFSIDNDGLKIIEDCGYLYDSSFNSLGMHKRYGQLEISNNGKNGIAFQISDAFYELPISNMTLGKCVLPWGGGGYFRLIPYILFRRGVQLILKKEKSYLFYVHPWETDLDQPMVKNASRICKFRHYCNLKKTHPRLLSLLKDFNYCRFHTCHQYLQELGLY